MCFKVVLIEANQNELIMKTTKALLLTIGLTAALAACGHHNDDDPTGSWTSAAPQSVTQTVDGAKSATRTLTFYFNAPVGKEAGEMTFTADYDVTIPSATDSVASQSYKATASVKGTWTQEADSHDDYLLTFDKNSLSVNGVDAPELGPVTDDFLNSLSQFTTIEDVEVSKDGSHMTFEVGHPEVKYHFVRK